jgi:tetratricopeptide (TPR) repeat protein
MSESIDAKQTGEPRAEIAEEYLKEGRYQEAIGVYRELVNEYPEQDSWLLALAWACLDGGQGDAAIDCFERLLERELARDIFTGFAFDELVRIFKNRREYGRLVEICDKTVSRYPDDTGLLGELGHACLAAGDAGRAAEIYERMVALDPDEAVYSRYVGDALMASGDLDGAERAYCRAAETDGGAAGSYYSRLADGLLRAGAGERAERVFRRCLECSREEPLYHLNLGDCLVSRGKFEEAEAQYEKAVAMNPASAGVYYNRMGNAFTRACRHLRAAECFRKATAADPGNAFYRVRLEEACAAEPATETATKTDAPE